MTAPTFIGAGLGTVVVLMTAAQAASAAVDIAEGRRLALLVCASCHVVGPDQPHKPILDPPAPPFTQIAADAAQTESSIAAYIATTHQTMASPAGMPNPQLLESQRRDVAAYLMSLRQP